MNVCANCGKPATCYGAYEDCPAGFACDECCGHGNEDGWCVPLNHGTVVLVAKLQEAETLTTECEQFLDVTASAFFGRVPPAFKKANELRQRLRAFRGSRPLASLLLLALALVLTGCSSLPYSVPGGMDRPKQPAPPLQTLPGW